MSGGTRPGNRRWTPGASAALVIGVSLVTGCASLPEDGLGATHTRLDNLRDLRYCELLLVGGDALAQDLRVAIYNTTDLNQSANPRDSCPAVLWNAVEAWQIQQQLQVLAVLRNGPRYWLMDWMELSLGTERDFGGLQARWMGEIHPPKGAQGQEFATGPYRASTLVRRSATGFAKGQPVFFLEGPDGVPWVMLSYATSVDPALSYGDLQDLGGRLKPPPGWTYRVKVLDKDLTLRSVEGQGRILHDELDNSYAACLEAACRYSP